MDHTDEFHNFTLPGGYNNGGGGYAQADFGDADETRHPAAYMEALGGNSEPAQGVVQQTLQRHTTELLPQVQASPRLRATNWRKTLRDMMIHQEESVIQFLFRPATEQNTIGAVEKVLRRYSTHHDVQPASVVPLKEFLKDASGLVLIRQEIEQTIQKKGTSSLQQIKAQAMALYELYQQTGEQIVRTEVALKQELVKMDKLQERVGMMMELRQNEALPELLEAFEKYLKVSMQGTTIEPQYKTLLHLYQKHHELREAIQILKSADITHEPLCPICTTDAVTHVLVPCGHTFCKGCATRLLNQCGICRSPIRDRMKIYFT